MHALSIRHVRLEWTIYTLEGEGGIRKRRHGESLYGTPLLSVCKGIVVYDLERERERESLRTKLHNLNGPTWSADMLFLFGLLNLTSVRSVRVCC
jgi:hypothetical protein